uniref:SGNH/GDSL hydrolase family protein n=1 Tax=Cupriavidus yeoncheonensis TaxID=1462994 RepID=UPI003F494929
MKSKLEIQTTRRVPADGFLPYRIDGTRNSVQDISGILYDTRNTPDYEYLIFAEGDSWFDLFTPFGSKSDSSSHNILGHLRTKNPSVLIDASKIGATAKGIVDGSDLKNDAFVWDNFKFHAILLSLGGNDIKNNLIKFVSDQSSAVTSGEPEVKTLIDAQKAFYAELMSYLDEILHSIRKSNKNSDTPVLIHGYDYITPRPAPPELVPRGGIGESWIYPKLKNDFTPIEMRDLATTMLDEYNKELKQWTQNNDVVYINFLNTLTRAAFEDKYWVGDWQDEIHPSPDGFEKLGRAMSKLLP